MATYVLLHGAGSDSWYWHLVAPALEARGHEVMAPDLPSTDESATFTDHADVVVEAIGDRREVARRGVHGGQSPPCDVILVAQSLAGFTAPLVADRIPVDLLVLVAAMVPRPGESAGEWWANTGHTEAMRAAAVAAGRDPDSEGEEEWFLHDVPPEIVAAGAGHVSDQAGHVFEEPWPLPAWPAVPTRFLLCRDDRFFPADFQRRVVRERLGFVPDEMAGGHLPALAHPDELVERLESYRLEVLDAASPDRSG